MKTTTRRSFIRQGVGASGAVLFRLTGLSLPPVLAPTTTVASSGFQPLTDAKYLGTVPFVEEGDLPLGTIIGSGLSGRLALDLSTLNSHSLITANPEFFIRTRCPDRITFQLPWCIRVRGLVEAFQDLSLEELASQQQQMGTHLLECSGNSRDGRFGLISAAQWAGIPVLKVLEKVKILPRVTRVLVSGFDGHSETDPGSAPGASWVFRFEEIEASGAFLATQMNGEPVGQDHGYPIRLVVPGWYACACIKWVNEIVLVDDAVPATLHMREFADRTHQDPSARLARDFKSATIDLAAMPIRVERWIAEGELIHRIVGILWGGAQTTRALVICFNPGMSCVPVQEYEHTTNATWTLWSHIWKPRAPGRYSIQLRVEDPSIRTRRLDMGFYDRIVSLNEV